MTNETTIDLRADYLAALACFVEPKEPRPICRGAALYPLDGGGVEMWATTGTAALRIIDTAARVAEATYITLDRDLVRHLKAARGEDHPRRVVLGEGALTVTTSDGTPVWVDPTGTLGRETTEGTGVDTAAHRRLVPMPGTELVRGAGAALDLHQLDRLNKAVAALGVGRGAPRGVMAWDVPDRTSPYNDVRPALFTVVGFPEVLALVCPMLARLDGVLPEGYAMAERLETEQ